jgi:hypothetical protein
VFASAPRHGKLFNAIDPAPFRQRDLDPDAEEFKQVNDVHGHAAGDRVIRTALAVTHTLRESDFGVAMGRRRVWHRRAQHDT